SDAPSACQRLDLNRTDRRIGAVADVRVSRAGGGRGDSGDAIAPLRGRPAVDGSELAGPGVDHVELAGVARRNEQQPGVRIVGEVVHADRWTARKGKGRRAGG